MTTPPGAVFSPPDPKQSEPPALDTLREIARMLGRDLARREMAKEQGK